MRMSAASRGVLPGLPSKFVQVKKLGRASVTGTKKNFRTESARLRQVLGRLPGEAASQADPRIGFCDCALIPSGMFSLAPKTAASPRLI